MKIDIYVQGMPHMPKRKVESVLIEALVSGSTIPYTTPLDKGDMPMHYFMNTIKRGMISPTLHIRIRALELREDFEELIEEHRGILNLLQKHYSVDDYIRALKAKFKPYNPSIRPSFQIDDALKELSFSKLPFRLQELSNALDSMSSSADKISDKLNLHKDLRPYIHQILIGSFVNTTPSPIYLSYNADCSAIQINITQNVLRNQIDSFLDEYAEPLKALFASLPKKVAMQMRITPENVNIATLRHEGKKFKEIAEQLNEGRHPKYYTDTNTVRGNYHTLMKKVRQLTTNLR